MERRANGPVKPVFQVHGAVVEDNVREEVTEKRGVLGKQGLQVQSPFGGDQFIQPDGPRRQ